MRLTSKIQLAGYKSEPELERLEQQLEAVKDEKEEAVKAADLAGQRKFMPVSWNWRHRLRSFV